MYKNHFLAGLTAIGLVVSSCSFASDTVTSNNVAIVGASPVDACVVNNISASRVLSVQQGSRQEYVQLQYQSTNNCNGQIIAAGSGRVAKNVLTGSFSSGTMVLNADTGALVTQNTGFAVQGPHQVFNLMWTRNANSSISRSTSSTEITRVPSPTKTVKASQVERTDTADVVGGSGDLGLPQNGSIGMTKTTLPR